MTIFKSFRKKNKIQNKLQLLCLFLMVSFNVVAKKTTIELKDAKIAVYLDIKDEATLVKMGVTIFGNHYGESKNLNYLIPEYVTQHLNYIFSELNLEHEFVNKIALIESELEGLKKREKRKKFEKNHEDFISGLKGEGFTDLLTFRFFKHKLDRNNSGLFIPEINGYGVYKIPGSLCIFQTLGYFHVNLNRPKKIARYEIKQNIPEKLKVDHACQFGVDAKDFGIKWEKDFKEYAQTEQVLIEKAIKDLLLKALLDTFFNQGIIKDQLQANQLFIEFMQKDYVVVEKSTPNSFKVNDHIYNSDEMIEFLSELANSNKQVKVLVGYKTKSKYTFGDLKKIFIPPTKGSGVTLYRLGPEFELLQI